MLATAVNFIFSFAFMTTMFAMLYKLMPRVKIAWKDVWAGATVTALLFAVGKLLIGLYIGKSAISSGFGAAGSLVVVLVWVYYSAQIFLLGAEFTRVYSHTHGSRKERTASAMSDGDGISPDCMDIASGCDGRGGRMPLPVAVRRDKEHPALN